MAGPNVIKDKPIPAATTSVASGSDQLSKLPKNAEVTVFKHPSSTTDDNIPEPVSSEKKSDSENKPMPDEFMADDDSEFGATPLKPVPKSHNLQAPQPTKSGNKLETTADFLDTPSTEPEVQHKIDEDDKLEIAETAEHSEKDEKGEEGDEDEKSAAELVAAAAAQIANKTMKKHVPTTTGTTKTLKATGKLLDSRKQEQIMKKAMLMLNESGKLNVVTDEPGPSIIKLNTPVNKAQIKLRAFRQNFEKQLVEMRRKTPLQIQALKAELSNIEFAEIGNKNIMAGLLELVDDHELKLLTIEKMLKHGEITLSF
jgi:hypothetical protein